MKAIKGQPLAIVLALSATVFALSFSVEAQQPKSAPRIGYLSGTDRATDFRRADGIRVALHELGYIEGKTIAIEYRHAMGTQALAEVAAELVRLKVDVIVAAGGDNVIREAMNATEIIPIILTGPGSDPVQAGFADSLARPGRNVTGITLLSLNRIAAFGLRSSVPSIYSQRNGRQAAGVTQRNGSQNQACRGFI